MKAPRLVRAAGVVPYRHRAGALQVALVHRPEYDDWSWPKGKLDRGEDHVSAAVRETWEETGLRVRAQRPLTESRYRLPSGADKSVRYWTGEVVAGDGKLLHEVDEVAWLSPTLARRRLTYGHDRDLLEEVLELERAAGLTTWSLLVVRHALALPRQDWEGRDRERPLTRAGQRRARGRLADVVEAYAPTRMVSSPAVRCVDTLVPVARRMGLDLKTKKGLSEEGFDQDPGTVLKHLDKALKRAEPVALCTHGPLLPVVAARLMEHASPDLDASRRRVLSRLTDHPMDKGEVLAVTLTGSGEDARVVAVERHRV